TITFWGPLEGEAIMEQAAALIPLAMSPERDEATAGGTTRVAGPVMDDVMAPDPAPLAGTVPESPPEYLLTRAMSAPAPQPQDVARLESAHFTWIGTDPRAGTPIVVLERESETTPGTFEVVTRRSGRALGDGAMLLTHTPDPLTGAGARTHYWSAEWQAVGWTEDRASAFPLQGRLGAPAGTYRFHVYGPDTEAGAPRYELISDPFEVTPATLAVTLTGASIEVSVHAPSGFRLLDAETGATRPVPLRSATVDVAFDGGAPASVTLDASGRGTVSAPATWSTMTVTDAVGNVGTTTR
ncbi:MAG: hypothetical protein M3Y87_34760, partial [Myxococcota bacterium]|nr:hypothetical protein [Myxococcota bacterium]